VAVRKRKLKEEQLVEFKAKRQQEGNDNFQLEWKGKDKTQDAVVAGPTLRKRWHLTDRSAVCAAVRRNLTNVSAGDFGTAVMADISRPVIIKGEIMLGAARIAAMQNYHKYMEFLVGEEPELSIVVHSYSYPAASCRGCVAPVVQWFRGQGQAWSAGWRRRVGIIFQSFKIVWGWPPAATFDLILDFVWSPAVFGLRALGPNLWTLAGTAVAIV
jgi:hypothetical protein